MTGRNWERCHRQSDVEHLRVTVKVLAWWFTVIFFIVFGIGAISLVIKGCA